MSVTLEEAAVVIVDACRSTGTGGTEQSQIYALAEETGEFVGAMRRWRGMARRSGTEDEAKKELADIIISAYTMAHIMGWDVKEITEDKLGVILTRGWKEPA